MVVEASGARRDVRRRGGQRRGIGSETRRSPRERRERRAEHRVRVLKHDRQTLRHADGPDEPEGSEEMEQMRHDAVDEFAAVGTLQGRGRRAGWREA